jgi:hypothetical protein
MIENVTMDRIDENENVICIPVPEVHRSPSLVDQFGPSMPHIAELGWERIVPRRMQTCSSAGPEPRRRALS